MKYLTLDTLVSHPKNVRANTDYPEGSITSLAASINALGLLQSLVVQQLEDGTYGVLAGRRRMMALQQLAAAGDLEPSFKVPCKLIAKDVDHVTALSLAENTMQEPMAPLEEYEAFAAMIGEGETVESIAATFGTTARTVKERLRFGLVHSAIRDAVRAGIITLDTMKAYASHPCLETQKRVFDGMTGGAPHDHQAWRVRNVLAEQDIRADDPLAVMVMDRYRDRGGEMVEGLFDEDTVLKDRALAESIRDEILMDAAEALRVASGFKWCETRARMDYSELSSYGRIYMQAVELDEEGQARLDAIAERLDEIAVALENDDETLDGQGYEVLNEEYEQLEQEADTLQNAYLPEQAAHAGLVVAPASDGGFRVEAGLVRAEDFAALNPPEPEAASEDTDVDTGDTPEATGPAPRLPTVSAPSMNATTVGSIGGTKDKVDPLSPEALSAALRQDLAAERAHILDGELGSKPDLARDVLTFRLAATLLSGSYCGITGMDVRVQKGYRIHTRPEAINADVLSYIEDGHTALDLSFMDASLSDGEKFRAFRALDSEMKARILAACVGSTLDAQLADNKPDRESFMEAVAAEVIADIRTVWRPTVDNYWSRVTRDHMLALLKAFGLVAEAEEHRTVKKATLAKYMESLFAQPFATLTEEQRIVVETWTPPGMGTQGDMAFEDVEGDDPDVCEDTNAKDAADGSPTYSNLEPDEKTIGQNTHGETLIEDANGVRSVDVGGVYVTEPVPVIPGAGVVAPSHSERKVRFLTVEEADERKEAA